MSIKGIAVRLAKENILPVTRLSANLAKYRKQLHLGDGGYGDQTKVGLRPAALGVYVDGEAVFEASPDGQEADRST